MALPAAADATAGALHNAEVIITPAFFDADWFSSRRIAGPMRRSGSDGSSTRATPSK